MAAVKAGAHRHASWPSRGWCRKRSGPGIRKRCPSASPPPVWCE